MKTLWLLAARYDGMPVVQVDQVAADFFPHLSGTNLIRKINEGDIDLPMVRMDVSNKTTKCISLIDLAAYLDARIDAARKENDAMFGRLPANHRRR